MMRPRHPCRAAGCTEPQVRAFELVARGCRTHARQETLAVLERHGLIEKDEAGCYRASTWAVDGWKRWRAIGCSLRYRERE